MSDVTLDDLRKVIADEGLKIAVRKDATVKSVLSRIEEKRAELKAAAEAPKEGAEDNETEDKDGSSSSVKMTPKQEAGRTLSAFQKVIDDEGLNLRLSPMLKKNPCRIQERIEELRKKKEESK